MVEVWCVASGGRVQSWCHRCLGWSSGGGWQQWWWLCVMRDLVHARVQVVLSSQGEAMRPGVQAGRQLVMQRRAHTRVSPASAATAGHLGWKLTKAGGWPLCMPAPGRPPLPDRHMHGGASANRHASPKPGGLRATQTFASLPNFPKAA